MSDRNNIPDTPAAPEGITLHFMHDDDGKASAFLIKVPDAVLVANPQLAAALPAAFMGSEPVAKRVSILAGAVTMMEGGK